SETKSSGGSQGRSRWQSADILRYCIGRSPLQSLYPSVLRGDLRRQTRLSGIDYRRVKDAFLLLLLFLQQIYSRKLSLRRRNPRFPDARSNEKQQADRQVSINHINNTYSLNSIA